MADLFRDYLKSTYDKSPNAVGDFVSKAFVFVRIHQRWWRGYRKARDVNVSVDGSDVKDELMTNPSWKLAPKELVTEFQTFSTSVDQAIKQYAFSPGGDDDSAAGAASAVLVGGGRYMVDAVVWPRLENFLKKLGTKWGEAADRWCTVDGHERLLNHLKAQHGEDAYLRIQKLVPKREELRTKFALKFRTAPVKIVSSEETAAAAQTGRRDEMIDLLELAVRTPREEVAAVWEDFANRLAVRGVAADNETEIWSAVHPTRTDKKSGETRAADRAIRAATILSLRRETAALGRAERYLDPELLVAYHAILQELPDDATAAKVTATALAEEDDPAIRLARLLWIGVEAARDEVGMCAGLRQALEGTDG